MRSATVSEPEAPSLPPPTIREIKRAIQRRVPVHYSPLPVDALFRHETELAYRQDFLELSVPPPGPSFKERLKAFVKRVFRSSLRWVLIRQVEFNGVLLEHIRESSRLFTLLDRNLAELAARVTTLQTQVDTLAHQKQQADQETAVLRRQIERLNDTLIAYRLRWKRHETGPNGHHSANGAPAAPPLIDYFLFESQFRGSREEVRQRQQMYLPYFQDHGPVLDIGCGRGEFVELLVTAGIPVQGIDHNPDMADYCRELGLPVAHAEALSYLDSRDDQSLGGIVLAGVVEQMTPEAMVELLGQCWTKLRKGGVLLVETLNPLCPGARDDFFRDPTHVRPVHPDLLRFLLESQQFTIRDTLYSAPVDEAGAPVFQPGNGRRGAAAEYRTYALIGVK